MTSEKETKNICTKGQVPCEYAKETGECKHKVCVSPTMSLLIATREGIREAERKLIHEAPTIAETVKHGQWIPEACKHCSNHPSNGGSGICFCTLGGTKITC